MLLGHLVSLSVDLKHYRKMSSQVQSDFDAHCKFFRSYAPDVFAEIMRVVHLTCEPEAETLDIDFEYV